MVRPLQINLSFWSYPSFLHDAGGRVIKNIGLRNLPHCIGNIMPSVATVTFVMYQNVHLLLNDIVVIADELCLEGTQMHRSPFCFSELHNSHFLHGVVLIN